MVIKVGGGPVIEPISKIILGVVCLVGWSPGSGGDRSPGQILDALDGIELPSFDSGKKDDQPYVRQHLAKLKEATEKRAALIWELFQVAPDHERIPPLMAERWSVRRYGLAGDQVEKEVADALARTRSPKLKVEGEYARAYTRLYDSPRDRAVELAGVDQFRELAPQDPRGATLLQLALRRTSDEGVKKLLEGQILREFPDSLPAEKILGSRRKDFVVGKPFDLEFTDAIGGAVVSVKRLKGKIVVIDFWATWCAPCMADLPEMKRLYAKYHDQGVEFIGVSLDQPEARGGLRNLKRVVAEKEITWPQYYQGDGWDGKFSSSCGINAIPATFLIDTDGNLASTEAAGKLDTLIPKLLSNDFQSGKEK